MREETTFCDVVFIVQGERFPGHRCLVAAASQYFHALLTNGMKETEQKEIVSKDVNVDVWRVALNYMYTAKLRLDDVDEAMLYQECANRFGMKELEDVIISYIAGQLDENNISNVLTKAIRMNCIPLRRLAIETFAHKFYDEFFYSRFVKLPAHLALECLRSDQLVVRTELEVLTAALRWFMCTEGIEIQSEMDEEVVSRTF